MTAAVHYPPSVEQFEATVTTRTDPTALAVAFAFTAAVELDGSEAWAAGTWEATQLGGDGRWRSRAVTPPIGPGQAVTLADGTWRAWCRIGGAGGVVKPAGSLLVR